MLSEMLSHVTMSPEHTVDAKHAIYIIRQDCSKFRVYDEWYLQSCGVTMHECIRCKHISVCVCVEEEILCTDCLQDELKSSRAQNMRVKRLQDESHRLQIDMNDGCKRYRYALQTGVLQTDAPQT